MTDAELEIFLGIAGTKECVRIMASMDMANLETEVKLWQEGLGPKPQGVIICGCGRRGRHGHRRGR